MIALTPNATIDRTHDQIRLSFERRFDTSADELWDAVTNPDRIARWLFPVREGRPGPDASIHMDAGPDDQPVWRVTRWEPKSAWAFRWDHPTHAGLSTLVTIEVAADGEEAVLRLTHDELTAHDAPEYAAGWQVHLDKGLVPLLSSPAGPDLDWSQWTPLHAAYTHVIAGERWASARVDADESAG
ncbi:MAG: SRPBCC domain-containing protein [Tetrasphaera sp.]